MNSNLAGPVANFLNQAAQDGTNYLNSNFFGQVTGFIGQISGDVNSLNTTAQTDVGNLLQNLANTGNNFVNSTLSGDFATFLNQTLLDGASFINSNFVTSLISYLQQATGDTISLLSTTTIPTILGTFLREASQVGNTFANSTAGMNATTFFQQAAQNDTDFLDPAFVSTLQSYIAPTSSVSALSSTQDLEDIKLSWSGSEGADGSGIASYSIYVSEDNGTPMPIADLQNTTRHLGHVYRPVRAHLWLLQHSHRSRRQYPTDSDFRPGDHESQRDCGSA